MKIKKGDIVKIISGNDKGKQGKVLSAMPREGKIVVEKINIKRKHIRPRRQGQKGELVRVPAPLWVSRVMLVCSKCGKSARVGYAQDRDTKGIRRRMCKRCGVEV